MINPGVIASRHFASGGVSDDPYWSDVLALLHFDGSYVDETGTVWNAINTPSISTTQFKFGTGSLNSSSGYLESNDPNRWIFGTDDYTAEIFAYLTTMPTSIFYSPIGSWANPLGWCFFVRPDGTVQYQENNGFIASASGQFTAGSWTHLAYSKQAGTGRLFINGVQAATGAMAHSVQGQLRIGRNRASADIWPGLIDEVRVTKACRYTSGFPVPTGPYPGP